MEDEILIKSSVSQIEEDWRNVSTADAVIICKDGEVKAHRIMLCHMSRVLDLSFRGNEIPGFDLVCSIPDLSKRELLQMLDLAYMGKCICNNEEEYRSLISAISFLKWLPGRSLTKIQVQEEADNVNDEGEILLEVPETASSNIEKELAKPEIGSTCVNDNEIQEQNRDAALEEIIEIEGIPAENARFETVETMEEVQTECTVEGGVEELSQIWTEETIELIANSDSSKELNENASDGSKDEIEKEDTVNTETEVECVDQNYDEDSVIEIDGGATNSVQEQIEMFYNEDTVLRKEDVAVSIAVNQVKLKVQTDAIGETEQVISDQAAEVDHDQAAEVDHNQASEVNHNQAAEVDHNQAAEVNHNQAAEVDHNQAAEVNHNQAAEVDPDQAVKVYHDREMEEVTTSLCDENIKIELLYDPEEVVDVKNQAGNEDDFNNMDVRPRDEDSADILVDKEVEVLVETFSSMISEIIANDSDRKQGECPSPDIQLYMEVEEEQGTKSTDFPYEAKIEFAEQVQDDEEIMEKQVEEVSAVSDENERLPVAKVAESTIENVQSTVISSNEENIQWMGDENLLEQAVASHTWPSQRSSNFKVFRCLGSKKKAIQPLRPITLDEASAAYLNVKTLVLSIVEPSRKNPRRSRSKMKRNSQKVPLKMEEQSQKSLELTPAREKATPGIGSSDIEMLDETSPDRNEKITDSGGEVSIGVDSRQSCKRKQDESTIEHEHLPKPQKQSMTIETSDSVEESAPPKPLVLPRNSSMAWKLRVDSLFETLQNSHFYKVALSGLITPDKTTKPEVSTERLQTIKDLELKLTSSSYDNPIQIDDAFREFISNLQKVSYSGTDTCLHLLHNRRIKLLVALYEEKAPGLLNMTPFPTRSTKVVAKQNAETPVPNQCRNSSLQTSTGELANQAVTFAAIPEEVGENTSRSSNLATNSNVRVSSGTVAVKNSISGSEIPAPPPLQQNEQEPQTKRRKRGRPPLQAKIHNLGPAPPPLRGPFAPVSNRCTDSHNQPAIPLALSQVTNEINHDGLQNPKKVRKVVPNPKTKKRKFGQPKPIPSKHPKMKANKGRPRIHARRRPKKNLPIKQAKAGKSSITTMASPTTATDIRDVRNLNADGTAVLIDNAWIPLKRFFVPLGLPEWWEKSKKDERQRLISPGMSSPLSGAATENGEFKIINEPSSSGFSREQLSPSINVEEEEVGCIKFPIPWTFVNQN